MWKFWYGQSKLSGFTQPQKQQCGEKWAFLVKYSTKGRGSIWVVKSTSNLIPNLTAANFMIWQLKNLNVQEITSNAFAWCFYFDQSQRFKGSVHSEFLIFVMIRCVFLTDLRSKSMTCYTFSVRPTIPEYRNVKVAMKKNW